MVQPLASLRNSNGGSVRTSTIVVQVAGSPVRIDCEDESLSRPLQAMLSGSTLSSDAGSGGASSSTTGSPVLGKLSAFDGSSILRRLPTTASHAGRVGRRTPTGGIADVYRDAEQFWIVDDEWGMAEIDLVRARWSAWLLPGAIERGEWTDAAVYWPLAQLLRSRRVWLFPAAVVSQGGRTTLIVGSYDLGPELSLLHTRGYAVLSRRWTTLVEGPDGKIVCRPWAGDGRTRRAAPRRPGSTAPVPAGEFEFDTAIDAVLVIRPGRRVVGDILALSRDAAAMALRQAWSIEELHPRGRAPMLPAVLSRHCRCATGHLSRDPMDLGELLESDAWDGDVREDRPRFATAVRDVLCGAGR